MEKAEEIEMYEALVKRYSKAASRARKSAATLLKTAELNEKYLAECTEKLKKAKQSA